MTSANSRLQWVDGLRGLAIVLMIVFHFCFDLSYFNLVGFDFYNDVFWLHARTLILSLFLFVTGMSLWLSSHEELVWPRIFRRFMLILICALFISLMTWLLFGERYVYFGVLHFIAIASIFGLLFLRLYWLTLAVAFALLVLGQFENTWFDQSRWRHIFGLMTHKPATEDYVPLFPWFGVVLLGLFFMQWRHKSNSNFAEKNWRWLQVFSIPGQYSLIIYMLHQPVLMSLIWGVVQLKAIS